MAPPPGGTPADPDFAAVKALFNAVCDQPDPLAALAAADTSPAVAQRVRGLLESERNGATHFSQPVAQLMQAVAQEMQPGDRLGAWTLVRLLGQGGMGAVYLAERSDGHYQQRAAIKLLQGWSGPAGLAQLARERQILAGLQHPNIARLIDGGSTPQGQPFLVMDFVEGQRIDRYLEGRDVTAVLSLFRQVAGAVAYAHRQLVVHCDLKPANVLVDADGRAMLLDFGIAQLEGGEHGAEQYALTPRYASPEQREGRPASAATDIYSLGAMLAELLAAAGAARPAEWRAIVARACEPEPERRYPSVDALLDDLDRYQRHAPLRALPPTIGYVLAKALRRRWPWALAGAGLAATVLGFTLQLVQERDLARAAERREQAEARATQEVSDFVVGLFDGADPRRGGRADMPVSSLVEAGRERIERTLGERPELRGRLQGVLGRVYGNLGRPVQARALYEQAIAQERANPVPDRLREAQLLAELAVLLSNESQADAAVQAARESLALRQARLPPDSLDVADAWNALGLALRSAEALDEARSAYVQSLGIRERISGPAALEVASTLHNMGLLERRAGQLERAESLLRRAAAIKAQRLPEGHHDRLNTDRSRALLLAQMGRPDQALPLLQSIAEQARRNTGEQTTSFAADLGEVAFVLEQLGRHREAIANFEQALGIVERVAPEQAAHARTLNNLAFALDGLGDPRAGERYAHSLAMRRRLVPPGDTLVWRAEANLGRWMLRQGQVDAARTLLEAADASAAKSLPPGHDEREGIRLALVQADLASGRTDAAADRLQGLQPFGDRLRPPTRALWISVQGQLATARGQAAVAQQRQQQAQDVLSQLPARPAALALRLDVEWALAAAAAGAHDEVRRRWPALRAALSDQHPRSPLRQSVVTLVKTLNLSPP